MRAIKSYVLRTGRITTGQQQAIEQYWSKYGLSLGANLNTAFAKTAPVVVEIGFGDGQALLNSAINQPETHFIGIEVHTPGVGQLLKNAAAYKLENLRVYREDAIAVLKEDIGNASLQGVHIFFPDPWHKKRHHKRRLVNADFLNLIASKIQQGGYVHIATDWQNYAEEVLALLNQHPDFSNQSPQRAFCPRPPTRIQTKFETRGIRLGHAVFDLIFTRT